MLQRVGSCKDCRGAMREDHLVASSCVCVCVGVFPLLHRETESSKEEG